MLLGGGFSRGFRATTDGKFFAPAARVTPFNEHAAKFIADHARYAGPTAGFVEQVYCVRPLADERDRTVVALQNAAGNRAVSLEFSVRELPYFTLWKNTASDGEGYVTGLEPGTNFPNNRRIERKFGRVPKLAPGASHTAAIDVAVHVGADAVKAVAGRIAAIQGNRASVVDAQPEKKD